jgi:transposase
LLYTSPMTVANHLTLDELWRRAKKAKDPIEKDRFLAVYHAKRGLTAKEIARIIPNTPRWVQETVRRYNLEGPEALKDKRHQNPGQKPKLTPEERMRVLEALQGPPPDGGLWTGPKLRDWVERELGKRLSLYPIYRLLHEMGFALRVPRPRHRKADGEAQEASNLFAQVQEARAEGRRVRLLAYDGHARRAYLGHRLGLRPVYRRVWARRGERPLAVGAHRYRWFYVCTFVEPETGESLSLLVDGVDTEVMGWVLRELRAWLGEGRRRGWSWTGRGGMCRGGWRCRRGCAWSFCPLLSRTPTRGAGVALGERGGGQSVLSRPGGDDGGGGRAVPGPCPGPRDPQAAHPVPLVA